MKIKQNRKPKYEIAVILISTIISLLSTLNIMLGSIIFFLCMVMYILVLKKELLKDFKLYIVFLLLILIYVNIFDIRYMLFPQAKYLIGSNPIELIFDNNPHAYRYIVAYPSIFLSNLMNYNVDIIYTNYCVFLFSLLDFMIIKILRKIYKSKIKYNENIHIITTFILTISIMALMNGRLVAAYAGISIIMYNFLQIYLDKKVRVINIFNIFIGFIMSTVSSGVMMVSFFFICIIIMIYCNIFKKYKSITTILILLSPIIINIIKYIYMMCLKNINYFGGGIKGFIFMLRHGFGRYFYKIIGISFYQSIFLYLVTIVFIVIIIYYAMKFIDKLKENTYLIPIYIVLPIGMLCGLFGISTATMIIPTVFIMINNFIYKIKIWDNKELMNVRINAYN